MFESKRYFAVVLTLTDRYLRMPDPQSHLRAGSTRSLILQGVVAHNQADL